jgi:hypothetical protein
VLLYFAPCCPLARPHRRPWQNPPCLQYSGLIYFFIFTYTMSPQTMRCERLLTLLLVADADETVTDSFFFTLFACRLFARALFRYKVLSDGRMAVARLERCFVR